MYTPRATQIAQSRANSPSEKYPHTQYQRGITLPEVLVALLLLSMISASSVFALRLGVGANDQLKETDAAVRQIQLARAIIKEDMAQIRLRPVRDQFGNSTRASVISGNSTARGFVRDERNILISFVRDGWTNIGADAPRSALQYVEYVVEEQTLRRRARIYLDDAQDSQWLERTLFENVDDAQINFLTGIVRGDLQWAPEWPLAADANDAPRAVSLSLRYQGDDTAFEQFFWIGQLHPPVRGRAEQ